MSQNDKATKEYLAEQLAFANQKLIECQENLSMNKQILNSVLSGNSEELSIAMKRIEKLTKEL